MRILQSCSAPFSLLHRTIKDYVPFRIVGESAPAIKGLKTMFLSHFVSAYQQWRRYNTSLRELNRLGDRELADIGISRSDIPRVAWEQSERA
jgi:uncharacterized protein YjiS (DUF1127 family)